MRLWKRKKQQRRQQSKVNELLIDLDPGAKPALYEQIYESIRRDMIDGRFSRGERLPSSRQLAADLQVSRSTVDAAYAQLVSEGYLRAKRGSGYYACDISGLYHLTGADQNRLENRAEKRAEEPVEDFKYKYNFLPGQVDSSGFAYNAWRKASKEALLELETKGNLLAAGHPQGEYRLRSSVASYLYRARGVHCKPEQIIIGAGNEYLLQLLGQILGGPRLVAMESPTYLQAYDTFSNIGYKAAAVPMDQDGMRVEDIPKDGVTLAYVMPSHQFPLGCVMPLERRMQLLAWAEQREDCYIIEDDHDSEFRYKGRPVPSLQGMAHLDRVIYLGTFSNSIMPSIRISYMVLPLPLVPVYKRKCGFYASTVSRIQQMCVCQFMEAGAFERHLNKMRGIYRAKHDLLLAALKEKTWVNKIYGGYAGLHIAVELKSSLTEWELTQRAAEQGICIQGVSACYIGEAEQKGEKPVLLFGFGDLAPWQIRKGVDVLDGCLRKK